MHTQKGEVFTELVLEVFKLSGVLVSEGDRISGGFGLSSASWKVLSVVAMADEPLTVAQVAREMGQARQSVQRIADNMVKSGYLSWKDNPAHKRAKLLALTEKGSHVFRQLESAQVPWANETSQQVDARELDIALNVLRALIERLET